MMEVRSERTRGRYSSGHSADDLIGIGDALAGCERVARVDDDHAEVQPASDGGDLGGKRRRADEQQRLAFREGMLEGYRSEILAHVVDFEAHVPIAGADMREPPAQTQRPAAIRPPP